MNNGKIRNRISRVLPNKQAVGARKANVPEYVNARKVIETTIDFSSLRLPEDVLGLLAEAFWSHVGIRPARSILTAWSYVKVYNRFVAESGAVAGVADINRAMLARYISWLNEQCRSTGQPWSKSSRSAAYSTLRSLLQWIIRCRPGLISPLEFPYNPFPWRNRDTVPRSKMPAGHIRAILQACETDIGLMRDSRALAFEKRKSEGSTHGTLGWLLEYIDLQCGGIVPNTDELKHQPYFLKKALKDYGGKRKVEPLLYPRAETLLPYYLAIMIHSAGNPDAIVELDRDCLQDIPLLEARQALVWMKPRARRVQRRTFSRTNKFEPPFLVSELLKWSEVLVSHAPAQALQRLFIFKGDKGIATLSSSTAKSLLKKFCARHNLNRFSLSTIRPGVLSSFYRASGNIQQVRNAANHANVFTTVRYVTTHEVMEENQLRISNLQNSFLDHFQKISKIQPNDSLEERYSDKKPSVAAMSMFGFDCKDPFQGLAPGSKPGDLCIQFLKCFSCKNAIITSEPSTLARLLQARDHLRSAANVIHPARWEAIYASSLQILENDILPRFSVSELTLAETYRSTLVPLPELR